MSKPLDPLDSKTGFAQTTKSINNGMISWARKACLLSFSVPRFESKKTQAAPRRQGSFAPSLFPGGPSRLACAWIAKCPMKGSLDVSAFKYGTATAFMKVSLRSLALNTEITVGLSTSDRKASVPSNLSAQAATSFPCKRFSKIKDLFMPLLRLTTGNPWS